MGSTAEQTTPLALPEKGEENHEESTSTIVVGGEPIKLDNLGPIVLQKDGSLSRITNWHELTELEQQRTLDVVARRNKQRREALQKAETHSIEL